MKSLGVVNG